MEKLSAEEQAYQQGQIAAFQKLGFIEKEAWTGAIAPIAKLLARGGGMLARGGGALSRGGGKMLARGAATAAKPAAGRMANMGAGAMRGAGGLAQKAGQGLVQGGRAFKANPLKAVGGGTLQAGQGMLFGGGKGIGGTIGKGIFGAQTASMMMPGGEQPQLPQPYGQY